MFEKIDSEIQALEAQLTAKKAERLGLQSLSKQEATAKVSELAETAKKSLIQARAICDEFALTFNFDIFDKYGLGGLEYRGKGTEKWDSSGCYGEEDFLTTGTWRSSSDDDC